MIHDAHLAIVHGAQNRMIKETNKVQKHYSRKHHALLEFVRSLLQKVKKKCQPDGDLKWILVYKDHLTKCVQLRPVPSKRAPEITYQLLDIFSIFGAPGNLQSDNGRELVNSVITELSAM